MKIILGHGKDILANHVDVSLMFFAASDTLILGTVALVTVG